jgi:hypothetical protein
MHAQSPGKRLAVVMAQESRMQQQPVVDADSTDGEGTQADEDEEGYRQNEDIAIARTIQMGLEQNAERAE